MYEFVYKFSAMYPSMFLSSLSHPTRMDAPTQIRGNPEKCKTIDANNILTETRGPTEKWEIFKGQQRIMENLLTAERINLCLKIILEF